jgi:mannose-binding lectin 2
VNNGSLHYDHDKDGTNTELAGCEAPFRNKGFDTFVAVRYQNYKLTVSNSRLTLLVHFESFLN